MSHLNLASEFCLLSAELLDQSMLKLRNCLDQLGDEQVWWRPATNLNSVGNLCLHVCGNLRQWGIVPFTGQADTRQREIEFSPQNRTSKSELIQLLEAVVHESKTRWGELRAETLLQQTTIQGFDVSYMQAISHTSTHFVGHTHQIIMLTPMQLGDNYRFQWSVDSDRSRVPI